MADSPLQDSESLTQRLSYPFADAAKVPNPDNSEEMIPARYAIPPLPPCRPACVPPLSGRNPGRELSMGVTTARRLPRTPPTSWR